MERFISDNPAVYIVGLLTMIAALLYKINENTSKPKNSFNSQQNSVRKAQPDISKPAKLCPNCSARIPREAHICIFCSQIQAGVPVLEKRYCRTCNARVTLDATVCLVCDDEPKNLRRLPVVALSILLFSLGLPAQTYAAAKVDSPCKKEGQEVKNNDKKFVCSKTGKKLIWKLLPEKIETIQYLDILPPTVGDITTKIECLKEACVYSGEIPQGSIIVLKISGDDLYAYGLSNGLTHISFRSTSPSGKVINYSKHPLTVIRGSNTTSFNTSEIGVWDIQIAGWIDNQQTEWSLPKSVMVSVLPQSAKIPPKENIKSKVLPVCSSGQKLALTQIDRNKYPLSQRLSDAQMESQKLDLDYQYASISGNGNQMNQIKIRIEEAERNVKSISAALDTLSSQREKILAKCDLNAKSSSSGVTKRKPCSATQISLMRSLQNSYWNLQRQADSHRSGIDLLQDRINAFTPMEEVARLNFATEEQMQYLNHAMTQASSVKKQFETVNSSCLNSGITLD
jgi:ribosomal protein L40E